MIAKTNKEAAEEIMNQLILRNLSGIIVVDFINIKDNDEIKDFMGYLKELAREFRKRNGKTVPGTHSGI